MHAYRGIANAIDNLHLTFGALLIEGVEHANASDLLELGAKMWNDGVEFLLHLGILWLTLWKMLKRLVHGDESVAKANFDRFLL